MKPEVVRVVLNSSSSSSMKQCVCVYAGPVSSGVDMKTLPVKAGCGYRRHLRGRARMYASVFIAFRPDLRLRRSGS